MSKHTNGFDPNISRPEGFPDRSPDADDKDGCFSCSVVLFLMLGVVGTAIWGVVEAIKAVA